MSFDGLWKIFKIKFINLIKTHKHRNSRSASICWSHSHCHHICRKIADVAAGKFIFKFISHFYKFYKTHNMHCLAVMVHKLLKIDPVQIISVWSGQIIKLSVTNGNLVSVVTGKPFMILPLELNDSNLRIWLTLKFFKVCLTLFKSPSRAFENARKKIKNKNFMIFSLNFEIQTKKYFFFHFLAKYFLFIKFQRL